MRYGNFQTTVKEMPGIGLPGDRASENTTIYTTLNFLAGEGGVTIGNFAWRDSTNPTELVKKSGTGQPLGIVERVQVNFNYDLTVGNTMKIEAGDNVTIGERGQYLVKADGAVEVGATVYANTETGAISFTSGDKKIATSWKAETTAEADGDYVAISNWAPSVGTTVDLSTATGTLAVTHGGTGLNELGEAGKSLKVNSSATGTEWA